MAFDFPNTPTTGQTFTPPGGPTYTWNGQGWTLGGVAGAGPLTLNVRTFTASGTYTPSAGLSFAIIECLGGGGGGGGVATASTTVVVLAGGGGSGGYSRKYATAAAIGVSQSVTIGAAGAAGTAGANSGGSGGATSVGSLCIANGGGGGGGAAGTGALGAAGAGASPGVGDLTLAGSPGEGGVAATVNTTNYAGGAGGGRGGAGNLVSVANGGGGPAIGAGGGGGGGAANGVIANFTGGNGAPGLVIITEYIGGSSGAAVIPPTTQIFLSGSGTYTKPTGVKYIEVQLVGGGGGGGGGNNATAATAGGATTFGLLSATGGGGAAQANVFGGPGLGSGGNVNLYGGFGTAGVGTVSAALNGTGGQGGASYFGGGGGGALNNTGQTAFCPGSGGGGGGSNAAAVIQSGGGGGAGGFCQALITSPAATSAYVVGTGGPGAAAGSNGFAGGNGAAGIIIVREFYGDTAASVAVAGGQLTFTSATALKFAPYGGNFIRLNGGFRQIPASGIAGLANTGVYVGGVAGQNLAASTTYLVFVFDVAGVLTADYRTGATHATSITVGNEGTEILTGDDTRSLIGMCRTNASSQFFQDGQNIAVLSWFNRKPKSGQGGFSTTRTQNSLNAWTEINPEIRVNFLCWSDAVTVGAGGSTYSSAASVNGFTQIGLDGAIVSPLWETTFTAANLILAFGGISTSSPTEGWHYVTLFGNQGGAAEVQSWVPTCAVSAVLQG
jgi:hypothetical protein